MTNVDRDHYLNQSFTGDKIRSSTKLMVRA